MIKKYIFVLVKKPVKPSLRPKTAKKIKSEKPKMCGRYQRSLARQVKTKNK